MGVPTDEETQSHVAFVQRALVEGEISDIDLKPNPGVQIKMPLIANQLFGPRFGNEVGGGGLRDC